MFKCQAVDRKDKIERSTALIDALSRCWDDDTESAFCASLTAVGQKRIVDKFFKQKGAGNRQTSGTWRHAVYNVFDQLLSLIPATGGGGLNYTQCGFYRKSHSKQWNETAVFVTDPWTFRSNGVYLWQYDRYHYNFDGKPGVFDQGELAESVTKWVHV